VNRTFASVLVGCSLAVAGCATTKLEPKDYAAFNTEKPRSILVVPVVNHSNEVDAADLFYTTLAFPLAERGYYTFPTNAAKKLMEAEGLGDPGLVHQAPTADLAVVFGADAVLYVEVLNWKSNFGLLNSNIEVEFLYTLKSGKTSEVLWQDEEAYTYSTSSSSGNIFADLIANAVTSMINNTRSDFTPMALQANIAVVSPEGQGLPFGPHSPSFDQNEKLFPATGSQKVSDATREAMSAPGFGGSEE